MGRIWILAVLITFMPGSVSAESFKCGNKFVETGDSKAIVLLRCGEPFFTEVISGDEERKIEQWTYKNPGYRSFLRILTFSNGQLVDIKVGGRVN